MSLKTVFNYLSLAKPLAYDLFTAPIRLYDYFEDRSPGGSFFDERYRYIPETDKHTPQTQPETPDLDSVDIALWAAYGTITAPFKLAGFGFKAAKVTGKMAYALGAGTYDAIKEPPTIAKILPEFSESLAEVRKEQALQVAKPAYAPAI